jgi:hypothetical protein
MNGISRTIVREYARSPEGDRAYRLISAVLSRSLGFGLVIVGLKIAADVHAHVAERRKFSPAGVCG